MDTLAVLRKAPVEDVLLPVLLQLVVILIAARLCGALFRKLGQPAVVGEIAAGLVLGPSALGQFEVVHHLFHPHIEGVTPALADEVFRWIFSILSQVGLILLLFLVGLESDLTHLRGQGKSVVAISLLGIVAPFALGAAVAPVLLGAPELGRHPDSTGPPSSLGFTLFLGTALAITALPVLGRMLLELNLTRTRLGAMTISSAAIGDALGWILLASVAAVVRSAFDPWRTLLMIGATIAFALFMFVVARPLLGMWARRLTEQNLTAAPMVVLLCLILLSAIATNLIGIFAIFGALLLGAVLSEHAEFREGVTRRLRDFVTAFFVPIFFTYTGLRTDIGSLATPGLWLLCGLVLAAAIVGKVGGCMFAAWFAGLPRREAACVGVLMNTRGLMELIVVNIGYDLHIIPPSVYCMLVLMALITTAMTTPLLLRLMRGTEIEAAISESEFMKG